MPLHKLGAALPTRMLDILERGHQVRDAAETTAETEHSSPPTIKKRISHRMLSNRKRLWNSTHCVVPPLTGSILVISRSPQTGQSTGVGADWTPCRGTAVAYPLGWP